MTKRCQGRDPRSASATIAIPRAGRTSQPVGDRTQIAVDTTSATPSSESVAGGVGEREERSAALRAAVRCPAPRQASVNRTLGRAVNERPNVS